MSIILALVILISAGLFGYIYFNKDKILQQFVTEINSYLQVKAEVESIELDIWDRWPYVSVVFNGAKVRGANCAIETPLLEMEKVYVMTNLLSLIKGDNQIQRLYLRNGRLYIYEDSRCANYSISTEEKSQSFYLNLEKIQLENVDISYIGIKNQQSHNAFAKNVRLSGSIADSIINFTQKGEWKLKKIQSFSFLHKDSVDLQANFDFSFNLKSGLISIKDITLSNSSNTFNAGVELNVNDNYFDLSFESQNLSISNYTNYYPESINKYLREYNILGYLDLKGKIKRQSKEENFQSEYRFVSKDLSLTWQEMDQQKIKFKTIEGSWYFRDFKDWESSVLKFEQIEGINEASSFKGKLELSQLQNPIIKTQLFTNQSFNFISKLLELPVESNSSGNMDIDISYEGNLPNKSIGIGKNGLMSGIITLNNLSFTTLQPSLRLKDLNGQLAFSKKTLTINSLRGYTDKSQFDISGNVENVLEYFFTDDKILTINTKIKSNYINLEEWIQDSDKEDEYILKLPSRVLHKHQLDIKHLKFKKINASDVKGSLSLLNQRLNLDSMKMNVAGGEILVNMSLDTKDENRIEWFFDGQIKDVFIDSVFYIFDDFNQDFIQQRHLKGQFDANFIGFMISDDRLNFDQDKLIFSIDSKIKNGRLIFFEPLDAVGKFIKEDDLMNLRFNDIQNQIFIKNRTINIPKMEVASNVRTILIRGTHTFDNRIDYHFEVPITKEKIDKDIRFGEVAVDKTGKPKLLIRLSGTTSDYKVNYDKDVMKENVKVSVKQELKEFKKALKKQSPKEEEAIELDEDEYFDFN